MEKVHLLKYPWVNGVVIIDVGSSVVVKFERGDCAVLGRDKLGKGHLIEGFVEEGRSELAKYEGWLRKQVTESVKDEVVGREVGDV